MNDPERPMRNVTPNARQSGNDSREPGPEEAKEGKVRLTPLFLCLALIAYIISPIDIIPDFIPGFGQVDDLGAGGALLYVLIRFIRQWKSSRGQKS